METLLGGTNITVTLLDGTVSTVRVKQITVGNYEEAFKHFSNELEMVKFATGLTQFELAQVTPESYEVLVEGIGAVNERGFFSYAHRRAAREEQDTMRRLAQIKPEVRKQILDAATGKASNAFVPGLQPK